MDDGYRRSLVKVLKGNYLLGPYGEVFARLPQRVQGMYPLDVIALQSASLLHQNDRNTAVFVASTLVMRGYDYETSHHIASNFQHDFPEFTPEQVMLMPRDMLKEEFGGVNGELLSSTLTDPKAQPILHAMLFGSYKGVVSAVERECSEVTFASKFFSRLDFEKSNLAMEEQVTEWQRRDESPLTINEAEYRYYQLTDGMRLPRVTPIFNPRDLLCRDHPNI